MYTENYVIRSLELHLFFARIMKEHSLFLKAGFTPANADCAEKAEHFKDEFEKLLCQALEISNGLISPEVIRSCELVTEFTALAEKKTECLTGININKDLTEKTAGLTANCRRSGIISARFNQVQSLNKTAIKLIEGLISFKENILHSVLNCNMFTANYPLLIEHIIREAKLYCKYVKTLEKDGDLNYRAMKDTETFWNRIMMEHAMFIRGLLDPCEAELFDSADEFAKEYAELLKNCRSAHDKTIRADSLKETMKLREFKTAGTQGIAECKIRSVILPLLADHVLREANHYIRLLQY